MLPLLLTKVLQNLLKPPDNSVLAMLPLVNVPCRVKEFPITWPELICPDKLGSPKDLESVTVPVIGATEMVVVAALVIVGDRNEFIELKGEAWKLRVEGHRLYGYHIHLY